MNAAKIFLPFILLAAAGGGAWFLLDSKDVAPPVTPVVEPHVPTPAGPRKEPQLMAADNPQPTNPDTIIRTPIDMTTEKADVDAPQGVHGRVLLPNGAPAGGVPVYLMKSLASDPIGTWLANRTGQVIPPVSQMLTRSDGTFALGVRKISDTYDVRVVPDNYPEIDHRSIKLHEEEWYDAKDLRLEIGAVVQGRVTEEGTGAVIQSAVVFITATNQSHQMLAAPGREKGIAASVDANGGYRIANAPRQGSVTIAAEADGYARVEKMNVMVTGEQLNEINLELPRGLPISGVVQDMDGKPIANASVVATAISSKVPQTGQAQSDGDGRFSIPALREGPYQLVATANMFAPRTEKPILAGEDQVHLKLEQQGMAKVRVLDKQGRPVKAFTLSLKRSFPNNPLGIGNVPEFRDTRIMPSDYQGDFALIQGIPNGDFVFQIAASKFARTLSEPFHVQSGNEAPEVTVNLTLGGVLLGRVVDDRGNPVAGATVSTDINGGFAADTEFFQIFAQFMPEKITKTSGRTDRDGRYRLPTLALGDYMLRAAHPDFCEGSAVELKIVGEDDVQVPDIVLSKGCLVEGLTTVGGQPTGQVKVQVGPPVNEAPQLDAAGKPTMMFSTQAVSDTDGRFRLLKRVPPGNYVIHASRQAGDNNPFIALLQMKQTERPLQVLPGQDKVVVNFDLPAQ